MSYYSGKRSRYEYEDEHVSDYDGEEMKFVKKLSSADKKRLNLLKGVHIEHEELEAKRDKDIAEIDAKYQSLYQPLYAKRFNIVNGCREQQEEGTTTTKMKLKGGVLSNFWLTAMNNNEILAKEITKRDEQGLEFLQDIKYSAIIDPNHPKNTSFRLDFVFDAANNPYFKTAVLSKTFHLKLDRQGKPVKDLTLGTKIGWLPGKRLNTEKPSSNSHLWKDNEACESFFNFFGPLRIKEENIEEANGDEDYCDGDNGEDLNDQEPIQLEDDVEEEEGESYELEDDYQVAVTIRDKVIPHAVMWYTGKAARDEKKDDTGEEEYEGCSRCRWR